MTEDSTNPNDLAVEEVWFDNQRTARVLKQVPPGTSGRKIVKELLSGQERPAGVIIVIGGARQIDNLNERQRSRLAELMSRGVAQAAVEEITVKSAPSALPEEPAKQPVTHRLPLWLRRPPNKSPAPPPAIDRKRHIVILDGGTHAGMMKLVGAGVADREHRTTLIGVAPYHMVIYPGKSTADEDSAELDLNHTHFVLPDSHGWGSETEMMFEIAAALEMDEETHEKIPVVVVLAGGTLAGVAQQEVLHSVRHRWPVMIIEGSSGVADRLADLYQQKRGIDQRRQRSKESMLRKLWWRINRQVLGTTDPALTEIVLDGKLNLFGHTRTGADLRRAILQIILRQYVSPVLYLAWARHADYDLNAKRHQRGFFELQGWILFLGVVATVLAVLSSVVPDATLLIARLDGVPLTIHDLLRYATIIVTVLISILVAYINYFDPGVKWILLRSNAEALKREIYSYRARADLYGETELKSKNMNREAQLAERVASIGRSTMRTEVSNSAVISYQGYLPANMDAAVGEDDGFKDLTPNQYARIRIGDQVSFFKNRTRKLETSLRRWQTLTFIAAGTSTLLAAFGAESWVPVVTTSAAAIASYIEYHQLKMTLIKYNQTEHDLSNLQGWWNGLDETEQKKPENINKLVKFAEQILEAESVGWARRMQDALADLRKEQEKNTSPADKSTASEEENPTA